jgi:hypothetical protein
VIASHPDLQEREALKGIGLTASMADALTRRGVPDLIARVTAELGALTLKTNAGRSGCRFRPGWRARRSTFGNNGSITAHGSSSTSQGFGRATPYLRINSTKRSDHLGDHFVGRSYTTG